MHGHLNIKYVRAMLGVILLAGALLQNMSVLNVHWNLRSKLNRSSDRPCITCILYEIKIDCFSFGLFFEKHLHRTIDDGSNKKTLRQNRPVEEASERMYSNEVGLSNYVLLFLPKWGVNACRAFFWEPCGQNNSTELQTVLTAATCGRSFPWRNQYRIRCSGRNVCLIIW
jgi:hypothetical protein